MDNSPPLRSAISRVHQRNGRSARQQGTAFLFLCVPLTAEAAGPVYFDLVGLILCILGYLLGLVVTPFIIGTRKTASAKTTWGWIYFAYIMAPISLIFLPLKYQEIVDRMARQELAAERSKNIKALSDHCNKQRPIVLEQRLEKDGASVSIHWSERIRRNNNAVTVASVISHLENDRHACTQTGVRILEEPSLEKMTGVRRSFVCTGQPMQLAEEFNSRYKLLVGEHWSRIPAPWSGIDSQILKASVRILDRVTDQTIAEDSMYLLNDRLAEGGCPSGSAQLANLLKISFRRE